MNEKEVNELLSDLKSGLSGLGDVGDELAFSVAQDVFDENEGLRIYLEEKGIEDPVGYIASRI